MNFPVTGPADGQPEFPVEEELTFSPALVMNLGGAPLAADLADHLGQESFTDGGVLFELGAALIADLLHTITISGMGWVSFSDSHKCRT